MSILLILLAAAAVLLAGYLVYGRFLEKRWGIDPARETPAQDCFDGRDFVPTPPLIVMGHHFASVAGAGTIAGPILAASFGWGPVLLWILIGAVFFGAAMDFGALFASLRTRGRTLGRVLRDTVGEKAQRLFTVFALLVLALLIACFTNIVASTLTSPMDGGVLTHGAGVTPMASTATASLVFILVALLFSVLDRKNLPIPAITVVSLLLMAGGIVLGLKLGLNLSYPIWVGLIAVYVVVASLLPVWRLLQPKDYLCAFLLYAVLLFGVVAAIGAALSGSVSLSLPAFAGFRTQQGLLFPSLFVLVSGGAVSGYHAMIASGTTAKQLSNEKHARPVAVGSMLLEALLAVLALLAVSAIYKDAYSLASPAAVFASGLATLWSAVSGGDGSTVTGGLVYSLLTLAVSVFALTTLDTCVRLARYLFGELFNPEGKRLAKLQGARRFFASPAVGTVLVVLLGCGLGLSRELDRLWGLFGAANLLLAGVAMLAVAAWLQHGGKNRRVLTIPMFVVLAAALCYLGMGVVTVIGRFVSGSAGWVDGLSLVCAAALIAMALALLIQGLPAVFGKKKTEEEEA